ncbi:PH domain-containing protein [Luteimonas vadosa]|uniref:PH domain-containing protein n=1 Tax=Luteimonas vadosa TaxID=1165507 RepID=A0ABP9DQK1_9GAMM
MTAPEPRPAPHDTPPARATVWDGTGWQPLPTRARTLFVLGNLAGFGLPAVLALIPIGLFAPWDALKLPLSVASLLVLPTLGVWLALKQYRYTGWRLDAQGFSLRRGRMWRLETQVPISRVQHLDLKRGPLERYFRLATLVIHTAGTRHSAVNVAGLDVDDAERLRDTLGRQIDDDDHADD